MMKIRRINPSRSVNIATLEFQVPRPDAKPQNILEKIVWHKETEVERLREKVKFLELRQRVKSAPATRDFLQALRQSARQPALIAEVKKASPSKGVIREDFDPVAIAQTYEQAGAACISVLTDREFFQGSFDNLTKVRSAVEIPLLCKEFILYPYQIYWARLHGADAVLLIAAILSDKDIAYFVKIIKALGMTPLVEVHDLGEFDRVLAIEGVQLIGINNRNLEDFSVDLATTEALIAARQAQIAERQLLMVSESGLHQAADLTRVQTAGASAVLIGESIVKQPDPGAAIAALFPTS
ncbi:MAG: indole-3-glycerol phosphate synthase TrpC [Spirulina sp. SIO3F2]|nr:indole-3-glycerol phosphate synthase TrpC [Spirulina sp. SIO3F2]